MPQAPADSLARLHDVVTPPPVPYTPQTVGWVVLAAALLCLGGWLGWRAWRRARANRYRRAALEEMEGIAATLSDTAASTTALGGTNEVLKRTALAAWPRSHVASLNGTGWLAFLDATGGGEDFRRGAGQALADRVYSAGGDQVDVSAVLAAARHWIRHHRVDALPGPEPRS